MKWIYRLLLGCLPVTAAATPVTVVELFTSQGCYSCPPADDLLGKLSENPDTIAVACHVTYWNYLGWRDTFSQEFCDRRQRSYQSHLKGNAGVYTPQMVINGRYGVVGSRQSRVTQAIGRSQQDTAIEMVALSQPNDGELHIELPAVASGNLQLWLLGVDNQQQVPIAKGENGGKQLTYHHPIRQVVNLGGWDGKSRQLQVNLKEQPVLPRWVVLVELRGGRGLVAAGELVVSPLKR